MIPLVPAEPYLLGQRHATLAEHLGHHSDEKLLIINADDFGLTPAVNRSIAELFDLGLISSTTLMATGRACDEAIRLVKDGSIPDCGLHLTLTSSLPDSPATPILPASGIPSLVDKNGHFYLNRDDFFANARPEEAEREAIGQIEKVLSVGVDLTHLDSHEGTLQLQPEFAEVYIRLGARFRLPMRMGSRELVRELGHENDWIGHAHALGLHFPDNFVYVPIDAFVSFEDKLSYTLRLIDALPAGVTELYFHPARAEWLSELDGVHVDDGAGLIWQVRSWDYRILTSPELRRRVDSGVFRLTSFRPLRELVRS